MIERERLEIRARRRAARRTAPARGSMCPGWRVGLAAVVFLTVAPWLVGCTHKLPPTPESPTTAVVGKRTITLEEVDQSIKDALFEQRFPPGDTARLFEARQSALDHMIDAEVVAQAAQGSGLSSEEWIAREVETRYPISEEDIEAFWQEYEHRIPKDRPEEEIRSDIREYLAEENAKTLVSELRSSAKVRMVLARPRYDVEPRGVPRGPENAPVTIVEFSDFECPYCARATPTIQQLLAKYPDQVRFYYRHLPLPSHSQARAAASAAVCAQRQGKFWAYHDTLFANQNALGDDDLRRHAEQVELDLDQFDACLTSPETAAHIDEDLAAAEALGVTGTPVFFVNGIRLKGAQPVAKFVQLIEEELAAQPED